MFFIAVSALHVSSGFSAYHQELKNYMQHRYLSNLCVVTASLVESPTDAAYTVFELLMMNGKPLETCRALTAIKNIVWRCILLVVLKNRKVCVSYHLGNYYLAVQ
jgi:fatty acid-binding protein DegV